MDVIAFNEVDGPYGWLSNMSPHLVKYEGKAYKTAEHLFQCLRFREMPPTKSTDKNGKEESLTYEIIREIISDQASPLMAKGVSKRFRLIYPSTTEKDLMLMRQVVRFKTAQHFDILRKLIGSKGDIYEDSTARQNGSGLLWGAAKQADGTWVGENHLGRIWMELRDTLQRELLIT